MLGPIFPMKRCWNGKPLRDRIKLESELYAIVSRKSAGAKVIMNLRSFLTANSEPR